jgi:hypothetical protein
MKRFDDEPMSRSDERHWIMLRRSAVESDRKFWSGERPISLLQGIGLLVMFLSVIGAVLLGNWPKGEAPWWEKIVNGYGAPIAIFLCFALFLALGNLRFHHKSRPSKKD